MSFLVLSSSRGTAFQAVIDRLQDGSLKAECLGLVSDRKDRGCVSKARNAGLPVRIVEKKTGEAREEYDGRLHEAILQLIPSRTDHGSRLAACHGEEFFAQQKATNPCTPLAPHHDTLDPQSLLLAAIGWMHILSPWFISRWKNRIMNVHPSLLPKYGGQGMYGDKVHEAVLKSGDSESGITIHLMDEGVDTGEILLQKRCPVLPGDTVETLKARVQELEKEWYPRVLGERMKRR